MLPIWHRVVDHISLEASENCIDERFFGGEILSNAASILTFQLKLELLISHPIRWVQSQMVSKSQHSRDLRVTFPADMKLVCPDIGDIAFEEMMTLR